MILTSIIFPLCVGIISGYIYGHSFVSQQRSVFLSENPSLLASPSLKYYVLRSLALAACLYYLLHSPAQGSILVVIAFILVFWLKILMQKGRYT